jgi:hypothetical protein
MKRFAAAMALIAMTAVPVSAAETPKTLSDLLGVEQLDSHDVTLALRDLVLKVPGLSGRDLLTAQRMLARPTDGGSDPQGNGYPDIGNWTYFCDANVCYHWVTTGDHAPPMVDANANTVPDQVDNTITTMAEVWNFFTATMGLRPPKDDTVSDTFGPGNPDGRFDIYLANIGSQGLYGYCTTDDPEANLNNRSDVSAYCVLDNDYSFAEFNADPLASLQVTAAHEFLHAVQYAYSFLTDGWILESMAAWIEDEVYTDVNDNLQYLSDSPISYRGQSLDNSPDNPYGSWIWWEFLSTVRGTTEGHDIIRTVLEWTDGSPSGPDYFGHTAIRQALSDLNINFGQHMAWFGIANATPLSSYPEGASYPSSGFAGSATVSSTSRAISRNISVDHLASKALRFRPGSGMGSGSKLRVLFDLPRPASQPGVAALVRFIDGTSMLRFPTLNADGVGTLRLQFNRNIVRDVIIGIGNASTRFNCYQGTWLSCEGVPADDGMRTLVRTSPQP